jgi:hypothetical protein
MKMAEHDFAVITFDFSRNGVVGNGDRITDFENFGRQYVCP